MCNLWSNVHLCEHAKTAYYGWVHTRSKNLSDDQVWLCVYMTDRVEEAGSVVCLCMRCVRRRKCSLMESCTSVGMSGEVRLIFTAASRKPIEPMGSFNFSVAMVTTGCWGPDNRGGSGSAGDCWIGEWCGPQAGLRDGAGR